MNGVRRFLNGNEPPRDTSPSQSPPRLAPLQAVAPLTIPLKGPSWPPPSPSAAVPQSPPAEVTKTTAALFLRKDKQRPVPVPSTDEGHGQPGAPAASASTGHIARSSTNPLSTSGLQYLGATGSKRVISSSELSATNGGGANARDQLFISLLSSEAVVDSREYHVLQAEEVEELKKEEQALSNKLSSLSRKVTLETKIRDAALSLSRANASYKQTSKQTNEQLGASEKKLAAAQQELWHASQRASEVNRRLLEHRAAVLSLCVRNLEEKFAPQMHSNGARDSPDGPPSRSLSVPLPGVALSPSATPFDGAHLFAGHASAVSPQTPRPPPSQLDLFELEGKLKAATDALAAASRKQAEMTRELSMLQLEKDEAETTLSIELQSAEETIGALHTEIEVFKANAADPEDSARMSAELQEVKTELAVKETELLRTQDRLREADARSGDSAAAAAQLERLREEHRLEIARLERELDDTQAQRDQHEQMQGDLAFEHEVRIRDLQQVAIEAQARHDDALSDVNGQLEDARSALNSRLQIHDIISSSQDTSILALVAALGEHLDASAAKADAHAREAETWEVTRHKLQDDIQLGLDKRQELAAELEEARREREEARREVRALEARLRDQSTPLSPTSTLRPDSEYSEDVSKVVTVLESIWTILPSPEARAQKMGARGYSKPDVLASPSSTPGSPKGSLSELDVRALKSLYDPNSGMMRTPQPTGPFSIQGFITRVQALIADDRALIERLIRFAQAHDLLKKNAERAQKLAQESNLALETYQKQVKTLEDRNLFMVEKLAAMEDEMHRLQQSVERITAEKQELEARAAAQAETCLELQDANEVLSARTLTLADEAAAATEKTRRQMEAQLTECQASLDRAQEEIVMLQDRNMTMMERQAEMEEQLQKKR